MFSSCCIIDQAVGCEWLLSSSLWLRTGCKISAATTSALFPPSAWRHLQPKSRPPLRKEEKKKKTLAHKKKYLQTLRALWIKHTELKVRLSWSFVARLRISVFFFFLLVARKEEVYSPAVIEALVSFNASCSCAKLGIYVLAPLLMKMRSGWKLSQWILPMAIQTELLE